MGVPLRAKLEAMGIGVTARVRSVAASAAAAAVALLAGCGSSHPATTAPTSNATGTTAPVTNAGPATTVATATPPTGATHPSTSGSTTPSTAAPASTVATTVPPTTAPPVTDGAGWTIVSQTPRAIVSDEQTIIEADGSHVVVARFRAGTFRVFLHVGSTDPPVGSAAIPADAGDAVSSTERPLLLAAFNGGFKASTGSGGVEVNGEVLTPLLPGAESVVVGADGKPTMGIWGGNLAAAAAGAVSVRQNLLPLVDGGVASPAISDVSAWGATLGGVASIARSALGEDAQGDLLYAGSMSALPSDMANALIRTGAQNAMELDINPFWVQLDMATTPGGPLTAQIPGQNQSADQYLNGWTRDFFTIVASA
jgi:hypothetical protein